MSKNKIGKDDTPDNQAFIKAWKYWVGQDWAVQFCCNWELQECALKQLKKPRISRRAFEDISVLNENLCKKVPVCSVNDDDWQQIITKEYASFALRDTAVLPAIRKELRLRQQQNEDIQTGFELISEACALANQYRGNSSPGAESAIHTVCSNLQNAVAALAPHMNRNALKRMEDICEQIRTEFPLSDESCHQLLLLRNRVNRLRKTVPSSESPADE